MSPTASAWVNTDNLTQFILTALNLSQETWQLGMNEALTAATYVDRTYRVYHVYIDEAARQRLHHAMTGPRSNKLFKAFLLSVVAVKAIDKCLGWPQSEQSTLWTKSYCRNAHTV